MKKLLLLIITAFSMLNINAEERPNIIWIMAEDISIDLECYGMKAVKTPHLNKLAENGIRFDNCFVTNPICSPSRSSMLVGTHQVKINAHNHRSNRDVPLNKDYKPFTYWLRKAGYTCILGHHGVMTLGQKIDVNFKIENLGPWDGVENFGVFDKLNRFEKEDQPFFNQIQLKVTHRGDWWDEIRELSKHPVNPEEVELPPFMADHPAIRLDWAKYLDQIEYADDEVAMIVKELEEKGMADNTIIIFIGDNGRCNVRGKGYLHDPGVHIPLIIYNPKEKQKGTVRKDIISSTDITATVLDYAGVEIPNYFTGQSILDNKNKREFVFSARDLWDEIEEKSRSLSSSKWKYIRHDKPEISFDAHQAYLEFYRPAVHVMRGLKEKGELNDIQALFFEDSKPTEELYDLENDPLELNNLAENPEYKSTLKKLRSTTENYEKEYKPVSNEYYPTTPSAVALIEWIKTERPEVYKQMQAGVEVGIKKMKSEYSKWKKTH